ncbi:MAG: flagellar biosynthetic protein FliQ [Betaproteobacteria bacterium]|nr:flagellar biosynthetic protein FliQ [Betaproteobacteria bacterium]
MDTAMVVDLGRQALWITMLVSAPLLVVGLAVGLLIGIFQAATSINEQTLSFIPKLIALGLTLSIAGGWMINTIHGVLLAVFGTGHQLAYSHCHCAGVDRVYCHADRDSTHRPHHGAGTGGGVSADFHRLHHGHDHADSHRVHRDCRSAGLGLHGIDHGQHD